MSIKGVEGQHLKSYNSSYSTRIVLFLALRGSKKWEHQHLAIHPGHPAPKKGSEAFESLERLLRFGMSSEAAYILSKNRLLWPQVEKDLPEELLPALKEAQEIEREYFKPDKSPVREIGVEELRDKATLADLIKGPYLIRQEHIPVLLDDLHRGRSGQLAIDLVKALSASYVWGSSNKVKSDDTDIVQVILGLYLPNEKDRILIDQFKVYFQGLEPVSILAAELVSESARWPSTWYSFLREMSRIRAELWQLEPFLATRMMDRTDGKGSEDVAYKYCCTCFRKWQKRDDSVCSENMWLKRFSEYVDYLDSISDWLSHHLEEYDILLADQWFPRVRDHIFEESTLSTHEIRLSLVGILDELYDLIGQDLYESILRAFIECRQSSGDVDWQKMLEELRSIHSKSDTLELLASLPTRIPKTQSVNAKRVMFLGTYEHILSAVADVLSQLQLQEQYALLGRLSKLYREIESLEVIHIDREVDTQKGQDQQEIIKLLRFLFLSLGARLVGLDSVVQGLRARRDELQTTLSEVEQEIPKELLDNVVDLYVTKLHKFSLESLNMESLSDQRTAFYWRLYDKQFAWMTEESLETMAELFGKLPQPLQERLGRDLLEHQNLAANLDKLRWWDLLGFKLIAQAKVRDDLEIGIYERTVSRMITSSAKVETTIAVDVIADAVCALTTERQTDHLEQIIVQVLEDSPRSQCLNDTVWVIVDRLKQQTGVKLEIPANLLSQSETDDIHNIQ